MKKRIIISALLLMTLSSMAQAMQDYKLSSSIANSRHLLEQRNGLDKERIGLLTGCAFIESKEWVCESQHILQKDYTVPEIGADNKITITESKRQKKDQKGLFISTDQKGAISASFIHQKPPARNLTIYEMQAPSYSVCKTTLPASFLLKTMGTESCFLEIQIFN